MDLFNFLHCFAFDYLCSTLLQVVNDLHHVTHSKILSCKLIDAVITFVTEGFHVGHEMVFAALGFCKFCKKLSNTGILDVKVVITWGPAQLIPFLGCVIGGTVRGIWNIGGAREAIWRVRYWCV